MSLLTDPELAAIERNHTRLAKIGDRGHTFSLFAGLDAEAVRDDSNNGRAPGDPGPAPAGVTYSDWLAFNNID
jgi:hypothetical protein